MVINGEWEKGLTNKTLESPTITGTGSIAGAFTGGLTGDVIGNASTATKIASIDNSNIGFIYKTCPDNYNIEEDYDGKCRRYIFNQKKSKSSKDKIDVEYLILKRRLYENIIYPQKRIQAFSPASGKPSVNKVMTRLQEFMDECYDDKGKIIAHDYEKCESHKKCRSCKDL